MDKYNHFKYGEQLARSHTQIKHSDQDKHYFEATEQDDISTLSQWISQAHGVLLIAIDGTESNFSYQDSESLMEQPTYLFAIVKQTEAGNSSSIFQAQQNCKDIALQIIARMMQDFHSYANGLHLLEPDSFFIKGFGPIADNFYGVLMGFSLNQGTNYTLTPEVWE